LVKYALSIEINVVKHSFIATIMRNIYLSALDIQNSVI